MVTINEPKLTEQAITLEREYKVQVHGEVSEEASNDSA